MKFTLFAAAMLMIVINGNAQITTAENGLKAVNGTTVQLGGTLVGSTGIELGNYDFHFLKGGAYNFSLNNGNLGLGNGNPGARLTFTNVNESDDPIGISWYSPGPGEYGIHRTAGPWVSPYYQQLRVGWGTGIILDPGSAYGKSYVDIQGNGLRVTSGNVGIGITNPAAKLSFTNTDQSDDPLGITWYSGDPLKYGIYRTAGSWASPNYQQLQLSWNTGIVLDPGTGFGKSYVNVTGNGLRITNGNLGIGTTSPHSKFEVNSDAGDDNTAYIPNIWDAYSTRFNGGNVSIFSSGTSTAAGDSYQLSFYARYGNAGQGTVTNKASFIKGTVVNDNNLYPGQPAGRGILVLGSTNTNYNDGQVKFIDVPAVYVNNGNMGIGTTSPAGRLHIKTSTADATASDFQLTDNANGTILSIRNDQKFTVGSGTQNTQLVIAGTGSLSGIYSPAYASSTNNIISFKDFNGNTRMTFDMSSGTSGSLGIGTTVPAAQLHTTGTVRFAGLVNDNTQTRVVVSDANGNLAYRDVASLGGSSGWSYGGNSVTALSTIGTSSNYDLPIITNNTERMRIGANGNVGIGTTNINDAGYKLFVEGKIRTRKIRVDNDNWPDYVFENNYQLTPLQEVEQYIQQQKHLPGVPSAAEVKKEGVDLSDNQAVLLKKIEELTLYVIQLQKKVEMLEKEAAAQKQAPAH